MTSVFEPCAQRSFGNSSLACTAIAQGVDEREKLM
jgi:hypothetical protein